MFVCSVLYFAHPSTKNAQQIKINEMIIMLMNEYEMMVHFIALPKMRMTITK
jgi:hypothetical protein